MQTVFSYIVSNRLSQEYENVATESLAFILQYSESSRNGMMKLLRGVTPDMPDLHFRTQQTEQVTKGSIRPDMLGYHERETRVFIENKFEAGLTDNQPRFYLEQLAKCTQPTVLLVVVPEVREETMWGELNRRLSATGISATNLSTPSGSIIHSIKIEQGPILALTSWNRLLSALDDEVVDDPSARSDLIQLRALCDAADRDAFIPISSSGISDQRMPAFILQLSSIVQASIDKAANEGILDLTGTQPQANYERVGRYTYVSSGKEVGFWFGIHFRLWKTYGRTPLWIVFSKEPWCRVREVWPLVEPKAENRGVFTKFVDDNFIVAIDLACGEEKDQVVNNIVVQLKWIANVLSELPQKSVKS